MFTDVTGSLERQPQGNDVHGEYWITGDDGQRYAVSDGDDGMLGPYAGQRVTVTGSRPGTNAERDLARLEARLVRSHARDVGIPELGMTTLRFAVRPHGQVPERTTFYGVVGSSYASHGFACDAQAAAGPRAWSYICVDGDGAHDVRITFTAKGAFSCGQVGFEPETDHGAFDIRATGVRCDLARSVAAEAVGHVPDEYRSHGFTCGSQATGNELNSFYYNCAKDGAQVSFTAS